MSIVIGQSDSQMKSDIQLKTVLFELLSPTSALCVMNIQLTRYSEWRDAIHVNFLFLIGRLQVLRRIVKSRMRH